MTYTVYLVYPNGRELDWKMVVFHVEAITFREFHGIPELGRAWEEADIWRAWQSLPAVPKNLPSGDTAVLWSSAPWWNSCAWRGRGRTSWVWGKRWKKGTNMDKLFKELSKDVQRIHSSMLGCTFRPWSCKLPKNESERTLPFAALQGPKCYLCHPSLLLQGHSLQSFGTPKQFLPFLRQGCNHDMSRWMQYIVPWSPCFDASMDATASISVKLWSKDFKGLSIFEYWMGVSQLWHPFVLCKNQPKRFGVVPNL